MSEIAKNSEEITNHQRILNRAERIWKLVHIEGYSYTEAWLKACPVSKAKRNQWGKQAKKDCDLFEKTYGKDIQKLLIAAGLGLPRVVEEISKSLNTKKIELYQGELVTDGHGETIFFEDNAIQQRGRELLTRIHGLGMANPTAVPVLIEIVSPDRKKEK